MKALALLLCAGLSCMAAAGQTFSRWFTDATLRVDYIFAGDSASQQIYLDALSRTDGWAGRRHALDSLCLQGNGRITMRDAATDSVIYRTSFSSLFQEWQATEEAARVCKSFENCFLLPLPKQPANVTVELSNSRRQTTARLTHRVDPQDILIRHIGQHPAPSRYLLRSGSPEECIDIVMVPEGYTEAEMDVFYRDATAATEALFAHEPFKTYRSRFNVVAAHLPSKESGVSVPLKGEWKETTLGSHFSTFYSDRYLTTLQLKTLHNVLAGIPYEHIVILANTDTYGGGGIYNAYLLTTTHNKDFLPVVVHEFGHSFAGLADEYFYDDEYVELYPNDVEPWERNITTLVDFADKWQDMVPSGTAVPTPPDGKDVYEKVGVYEGAGYQSKGVYRGCQECRMKVNSAPSFCPVCRRALTELIRFYTR